MKQDVFDGKRKMKFVMHGLMKFIGQMLKIIKIKNPRATEKHLDNHEEEFNDQQYDEINALNSFLAIMEPNETVLGVIKKLGGDVTIHVKILSIVS